VATVASPPDPLLSDGYMAMLTPRRDPAGLSAAIDRVLGYRWLADRLARGGKALAERRSWASSTAAHRRLIAQLLHELGHRHAGASSR
jgi:hypothetical protein